MRPCTKWFQSFFCSLRNGRNDKKISQDHVKMFVKNLLSSKQAELYLRGISKLPDKWQEEIQNNGKYSTEWNSFIVKLFKSYILLKREFLMVQTYIRGSLNKFPDFFFVWALLLIVHTWNSSPLPSNLLRLQCTCCTVPTTSGRPHRSPLVWACQWPSSQPLSSQLSHNHSLSA